MASKIDLQDIPVGKLLESENNPQEMTASEFNKLVDSIESDGFDEPLVVNENGDGTYQILSGHHRFKACRILGFESIPCVVKHIDSADLRTAKMIKSNVLRGKMSAEKFTKIVNDMATRYTKEEMESLFGFADRKAFNQLYKEIRASLPDEIREKLDATKKEIRTIDDLARILNGLFAQYGGTLDQGYMFFSYGGKDHYVVQLTDKLLKTMQQLETDLKASGKNINEELAVIIPAGYKKLKST